jgi:hypothetical protein
MAPRLGRPARLGILLLLSALGLLLSLTSTKVRPPPAEVSAGPAPPDGPAEQLRARFLPQLETLQAACAWYNRTVGEEAGDMEVHDPVHGAWVLPWSMEPRSR